VLNLVADFTENLGGSSQIYASGGDESLLTITAPGRASVTKGEKLAVSLSSGRVYGFDASGQAL
jgi:lactose/L-arabinose transport system ATP-binding protein